MRTQTAIIGRARTKSQPLCGQLALPSSGYFGGKQTHWTILTYLTGNDAAQWLSWWMATECWLSVGPSMSWLQEPTVFREAESKQASPPRELWSEKWQKSLALR